MRFRKKKEERKYRCNKITKVSKYIFFILLIIYRFIEGRLKSLVKNKANYTYKIGHAMISRGFNDFFSLPLEYNRPVEK